MHAVRIFSWILLVCSLSFALSTAAQEITRREITGFNSEGMGLTATVLRFCAQEKLPVAITYIDAQSLREPLTISLGRMSVAQALDSILKQHSTYRWIWRGGMVEITNEHSPSGPRNVLDTVIPVYELRGKTTVQSASVLLWMSLELVLNPGPRGFAGGYDPGDVSQAIGSVRLVNRSVGEILSYIVVTSGADAWLVTQPPEHLDKIPVFDSYALVTRNDVESYLCGSGGPISRCVGCSYFSDSRYATTASASARFMWYRGIGGRAGCPLGASPVIKS